MIANSTYTVRTLTAHGEWAMLWTWLKFLSKIVMNALYSPRRVEMFAPVSMFNGPIRLRSLFTRSSIQIHNTQLHLFATSWVSNATASHIMLFEITTRRIGSISPGLANRTKQSLPTRYVSGAIPSTRFYGANFQLLKHLITHSVIFYCSYY